MSFGGGGSGGSSTVAAHTHNSSLSGDGGALSTTLTQIGSMWFIKYKKICRGATVVLTIIGFVLLIIAGHLGASITYGK